LYTGNETRRRKIMIRKEKESSRPK
jgi:hypothetical protein